MVSYIYIWKSAESDKFAEYTFSPEDGVEGKMTIGVKTGDMKLTQPCPGDETNSFYQSACKAVWKHWAVGNLPETTQFIYGG